MKLSELEFSKLSASFRTISGAIDDLLSLQEGLVSRNVIEELEGVYKQLKAELKKRGYSEEEIADLT